MDFTPSTHFSNYYRVNWDEPISPKKRKIIQIDIHNPPPHKLHYYYKSFHSNQPHSIQKLNIIKNLSNKFNSASS